jgi:hypothetical protein
MSVALTEFKFQHQNICFSGQVLEMVIFFQFQGEGGNMFCG